MRRIWLSLALLVLFSVPTAPQTASASTGLDCTITIPESPYSAKGLSTPYVLSRNCHETDGSVTAFAQAAILNPHTGSITIYHPLVVDTGVTPVVAPIIPSLPDDAIVAIWFGFNGDNLRLRGDTDFCVNGSHGSIFGQYSYCQAPKFFRAANDAVADGLLKVPPLGIAIDGLPCPTVRDFSVVDQDQSDNVQTSYLAVSPTQVIQDTAANRTLYPLAAVLKNPSDNRLLTSFIDPAIGCHPWLAPSLDDKGTLVPSLALDELQAAFDQGSPVAYVPLNDPMTMKGTKTSLHKTSLYRAGVDQPHATAKNASTTTYCMNMVKTGLPRLILDRPYTSVFASPFPNVANSLYTFLASRFSDSYTILGCATLLGQPNPVGLTYNGSGIVVAATL